MTVGRMMMYQHAVIVLLLVSVASALEMPFLKQNITDEDIFLHLHDVIAKRQPEEMARGNMSFSGHRRFASNLTLDERCKRGMPLSVRWTNYGPYGSLVRARNDPRMSGIGLTGIFPSVINKVLKECCHRNTRVVYGQYTATLKGMETNLSTEFPEDMTFPVGLQSMDMQVFKDFLVVPLLRAPRTTLLVPELKEQRGQTLKLFKTVRLAWPILAFIFLAAIVSGVFIWILDHLQNPDEFPTTFTHGVWEGFWWAVVTMTTVGYGDRAPRSILGRLFCVIWIVTGMSIIAIFTAMVTASLSASIQYRLVIHGSVMGAVDGSQEERIGTGMNADIKTFETPKDVVEALVETSDLKLAIMDSYLLSYYHEVIQREPVRVKANLEQPINYGLLLAQNSSYFTQCFKQFIRNNPQDIFNSIRKNLNPLKNPTDDVTEELKASQGFLHEKAFHKILYGLAGFVGAFALIGLLWECLISRHLCGKRRRKKENIPKKAKKSLMQSLTGFRLAQDRSLPVEDITHLEMITQNAARVRQLIREYDEFYEKWIEQLKEVTGGEVEWKNLKQNDKNGSLLMVAYSDKAT